MYDVLRKMEDYDPKVIREAFPDDSHESLHRIKSILLNEVVKYIYESHPFNGKRDLWQMIGEAKHLRDVAADSIALNRINAAIKLALGMEAMAELLDAIKLRRKLVEVQKDDDEVDFLQIEEYALRGIEETTRVDRLYSELFRIKALPATQQLEAVTSLEKKLLATPQPTLIKNQLQVLNVQHYVERKRSDIRACIFSSCKIIDVAESQPKVLMDTDVRDIYFYAVTFLAVAYADQKEFAKAENYLEKIKDLARVWGEGLEQNPNLNARYIYSSLAAKIAMKDWKAVHEITKRVYREVVQQNKLNNVLMQPSVLRLSATASFLVRDYSLARKLALSIRSSMGASNAIVSQQHWAARIYIVTLLTYVEENDPHLKYGLKEMTNWLRTFGPVNAFETAIIRFFSQVGGDPEIRATPPILLQFKADLEAVFLDDHFRAYRDAFPLTQWIESKLSGRDLREFDFD